MEEDGINSKASTEEISAAITSLITDEFFKKLVAYTIKRLLFQFQIVYDPDKGFKGHMAEIYSVPFLMVAEGTGIKINFLILRNNFTVHLIVKFPILYLETLSKLKILKLRIQVQFLILQVWNS
jgi:hypothetical protein